MDAKTLYRKDRQTDNTNAKKKRDKKTINGCQNTVEKGLSNTNITKTMDATRVLHKGIQVVPAPLVAPVVLLLLKIRR
jgi:hypothetical protein